MPTVREVRSRAVRLPGDVRSPGSASRAARVLSYLAVLAMVATSVTGLLEQDAYGDPESLSSMLRGYDAVALVVSVPLLLWAITGLGSGWVVPALVRAAVLGSAAYTYAYHVFATGFTDLMLLHVATFSVALFGFVLALVDLDVAEVRRQAQATMPVGVISGVLGVLALGLGGMWIGHAVNFAVTGTVPTGSVLVETEQLVRLGMVLDLALLVPLYGAAAVLLWRRTGWGVALAAVALVSGVIHQIGYLVAMPFQVAADVPDAVAYDPLEPVIVLLYVLGLVLLLRHLRRPVTWPPAA